MYRNVACVHASEIVTGHERAGNKVACPHNISKPRKPFGMTNLFVHGLILTKGLHSALTYERNLLGSCAPKAIDDKEKSAQKVSLVFSHMTHGIGNILVLHEEIKDVPF